MSNRDDIISYMFIRRFQLANRCLWELYILLYYVIASWCDQSISGWTGVIESATEMLGPKTDCSWLGFYYCHHASWVCSNDECSSVYAYLPSVLRSDMHFCGLYLLFSPELGLTFQLVAASLLARVYFLHTAQGITRPYNAKVWVIRLHPTNLQIKLVMPAILQPVWRWSGKGWMQMCLSLLLPVQLAAMAQHRPYQTPSA